MNLVAEVRRYCARTGTPPTRFGRGAVNDPRLVGDLMNGRRPGRRVVERVEAFIAAHPEGVR